MKEPQGMQGLGRELPEQFYQEALDVAAKSAKKIRMGQEGLAAEKSRIDILNWGDVTGQELYVDGGDGEPIISRDGRSAVFLILQALDELDSAKKALAIKAVRENGIAPMQKGSTARSLSAYYTFEALKDVESRAVPTLTYWKWYEFKQSSPSNRADAFDAWVKSGLAPLFPDIHIPDVPKLPGSGDVLLYGLIGLGILFWISGK
jgi:hypothetical protein